MEVIQFLPDKLRTPKIYNRWVFLPYSVRVVSLLGNCKLELLQRHHVVFLSQPRKYLARRISSNASEPLTDGIHGAVDYGVHVIWHDHIADQLVRISLSDLTERINEHLTGMIATKHRYSLVRHKRNEMKCILLV